MMDAPTEIFQQGYEAAVEDMRAGKIKFSHTYLVRVEATASATINVEAESQEAALVIAEKRGFTEDVDDLEFSDVHAVHAIDRTTDTTGWIS